MADEASVRISLQVSKGNLVYQSQPTAFSADVEGDKGPTPGSVTVTTTGTDIDLTELTELGGLCRIMNIDDTNYVQFGIHDGTNLHLLGKVLPGETYVIRLSDNLEDGSNRLRFKANGASVIVLVEAFDP